MLLCVTAAPGSAPEAVGHKGNMPLIKILHMLLGSSYIVQKNPRTNKGIFNELIGLKSVKVICHPPKYFNDISTRVKASLFKHI